MVCGNQREPGSRKPQLPSEESTCWGSFGRRPFLRSGRDWQPSSVISWGNSERLCYLKLRDLLGPDGEVTNIAFQLELHVHQTGSWNMVATLPRWVGHISQEHKRDSQ